MVGALLVAAAAVAVFAAFLSATSAPTTRYLVADTTIAPGTLVEDRAAARELFAAAPIDLLAPVDRRVVSVDRMDELVGRVVLVAMERGDLLHHSGLQPAGHLGGVQVMSFAVPSADAVAGELVPGERVDVLATHPGSGEPYTAFVVRGVPLVAVDSSSGSRASVVLTVGVSSLEDVQALGHAVNTASVFVTRSGIASRDAGRAPGSYVPSAGAPGPLPDPATVLRTAPARSAQDDGRGPAGGGDQ